MSCSFPEILHQEVIIIVLFYLITCNLSTEQGVLLTHNKSERFESRFATVTIKESPAIMLQGMEGSIMGIWVAHGEGKKQDMVHRDDRILDFTLNAP